MAGTDLGAGTLLGSRLLELLRIRSAQLGECEPCSQSRKHDSITDEDVACLVAPGTLVDGAGTTGRGIPRPTVGRPPRDRRRVLPELGEHFTAAQIIELGFTCAATMGLHRFIHTLDVYGDSIPSSTTPPTRLILLILEEPS